MSDTELSGHARDLYRGLRFPPGDRRPFVAVNLVASVDGRAVVGGGARALGSALDRSLMRRLRAAADCVLVGAATLRAEGYDAGVGAEEAEERRAAGLAPQPLAAAVTASGELPPRRGFFRVAEQRAIVLTSTAAAEAHRARFESLRAIAEVVLVESRGERLSVAEILDALGAQHGVRRLLVEGGPSLVGELFAADAVDQLFLTLSPRVVGGDERTILGTALRLDPPRPLALLSATAEAGFLYLRYEIRR